MRNNIRRNRNIGTFKQGYGQNNKMTIPRPVFEDDIRIYYERLVSYKKIAHIINGHEFIFITEETLSDYTHACSVNDIIEMLEHIPNENYGELRYIVLRQPKRKEDVLSPVWGRLIYFFEFENGYYPAIILEAFRIGKELIRNKKMSVDAHKEFQRLQKDGFVFTEDKKYYKSEMTIENVRNVQLYRTLLHELGHYKHYWEVVESFGDEEYEEWEKRWNFYRNNIPTSEKEAYAHNYADKMREEFIKKGIIPFERKE